MKNTVMFRKVTADDASDSDTTSGNLLDGRSRHDEDLIFDRKPSQHSFVTTWGPVGFQKKLHPLSIMVHSPFLVAML